MRALVTGGAGMIGSHLVDLLLGKGAEVTILDSLEPETHPGRRAPAWLPDVSFYQRYVQNATAVADAVKGCDVVFHLAACGGFAPDVASKMMASNALGTAVVAEACAKEGVHHLVVASSQAVYGHGGAWGGDEGEMWLDGRRAPSALAKGLWEALGRFGSGLAEDDPIDLATPYATSKYAGERVALQVGEAAGLPVTALRFALTYGPRQSPHNPYTGIASIFATRLLNGLPPVIYEDGKQTRDFVYVGDVARACWHVALHAQAAGKVFNVGTGVGTTVMEFAKLIQGELGGPDPILTGEYRPGDARHVVCDATKLRGLGWEPETPLRKGIEIFCDWFREEGAPPDSFGEAQAGMRDAGLVKVAG